MSYILKDTTQGIISVKLTDAGRKKLSQGKLNIELFQLGDYQGQLVELKYNKPILTHKT